MLSTSGLLDHSPGAKGASLALIEDFGEVHRMAISRQASSTVYEITSDEGIGRYLRLIVAILFLWLNQYISLATKIA